MNFWIPSVSHHSPPKYHWLFLDAIFTCVILDTRHQLSRNLTARNSHPPFVIGPIIHSKQGADESQEPNNHIASTHQGPLRYNLLSNLHPSSICWVRIVFRPGPLTFEITCFFQVKIKSTTFKYCSPYSTLGVQIPSQYKWSTSR